jgi:hypothetical protein
MSDTYNHTRTSISNDSSYGSGNEGTRSTRETSYIADQGNSSTSKQNWGNSATRSLYSAQANLLGTAATGRDLLQSRLWHGVPQLTQEQMGMFEAAYTGHQFMFVVDMPKFLTSGIYENTNAHQSMRNLKAIIERASTGFSGASNITAEFSDQDDGNDRKMSHVVRVHKPQDPISIKLHEFAALPVKNAIETWLTGIYDYQSMHGNYHGNLGIPGGWCMKNHTMSILVVQVDPSWTEIQDASYYFNMIPNEVPFDNMSWTKGEYDIIQDYDIQFTCNEIRTPMVMNIAEKYVNNRILKYVESSVYNSRRFVPRAFSEDDDIDTGYQYKARNANSNSERIIDDYMYGYSSTTTGKTIDSKTDMKEAQLPLSVDAKNRIPSSYSTGNPVMGYTD